MKISALAAATTVTAIAQAAPQAAPAAPAAPAPAGPNGVDGAAADAPIPAENALLWPPARLTPPRPDDYATPTPTASTTMATVTGTITVTGAPTGVPTAVLAAAQITSSEPQPKMVPGINEIPPWPPAAGPGDGAKPPPGAKPPVDAKPPTKVQPPAPVDNDAGDDADDVDEPDPTIDEIRIPNRLLNNASKALDYISDRIAQLGIQINKMMSSTSVQMDPSTAQQIVNSVRMPLESLESVLKAATATVKLTGIKVTTPIDLKDTASDPNCDGLCLLGKANKIVLELSAFGNAAAQRSGLEEVGKLVKPVTDAAKALVVQLDGDIPGNNKSGRH